ncbi:heterokaryon incompatibility protein-domain-containing protein [Hyaloscypha finlandica]|nr:heterokaryon incompatibility protein-domain-containing protein [Hyaloscypha finlandica]
MSQFVYEPLLNDDSIRLILLQPSADPLSRIHCNLSHTTLVECKNDIIDHYTALSYVWGDPLSLEQIFLNGRRFPVTSNLFNALRDLRHEQRLRRVWIDAICINQSDVQERNKQVGLMGSIYSLAQHTIIYLGPATAESDTNFQALRASKVELPQSRLRQSDWPVAELLNWSWFSRVWIFQELVLSRDPWIQCGRDRIRWDEFCSDVEKHSQNLEPDTVSSGYQIPCYNQPPYHQRGERDYHKVLMDMQKMRLGFQLHVCGGRGLLQGGPPSLLEVLVSRRGFGVTNPRDMVFAHLGIVDVAISSSKTQANYAEDETSLLRIDYGKPVAQVYTDAARSSIQRSGNLLVLRHAGNIDPSMRRVDLPSWVPDWMSTFPVKPFHNNFEDPPKNSEQLGLSGLGTREHGLWTNEHPVHIVWPQDTSALVFDGHGLDIIRDVSPVVPCYDGDVDRRLGALINSLRIKAGEQIDTKQQTLLWRESYDEWRKKPGFKFLKTLPDDDVEHLSLAAHNLRVHSDLLTGRSIALFQSGNIGIIPSSARPGDLICTSYKESLRLVLRRQQVVHEHFDKEITTRFSEYYKAQGTSPAEMANSGLKDIDIPYADEQGMPKPNHVSFIGECFYASRENSFSNILSIFVVH